MCLTELTSYRELNNQSTSTLEIEALVALTVFRITEKNRQVLMVYQQSRMVGRRDGLLFPLFVSLAVQGAT